MMQKMRIFKNRPLLHDLPPSASALTGSDNKQISIFSKFII